MRDGPNDREVIDEQEYDVLDVYLGNDTILVYDSDGEQHSIPIQDLED